MWFPAMISGWKWLLRMFIRLNVLICVLPLLACVDTIVILCQGMGASTKCSKCIAWLSVTAICFFGSLYILGWSTTYLAEQHCSVSLLSSLPCACISFHINCLAGLACMCRISIDMMSIGVHLLGTCMQYPWTSGYTIILLTSAYLA